MTIIAKTKREAFAQLLDQFHEVLSNNGCNDFEVANTPEMYLLIEQAAADNLGLTLEEFHKREDYKDEKPMLSKDKKTIYTSDFVILALIEKELGL